VWRCFGVTVKFVVCVCFVVALIVVVIVSFYVDDSVDFIVSIGVVFRV
jgi:hypothetical protein